MNCYLRILNVMLRPTIIIIFSCCLAAAGCIDLKGISTFSSSSAHTLVTTNNLSYGYASYTADSCYIYNKTGKDLKDFLCDATVAKEYDSLLHQEFSTLAGYFAALSSLAGNTELINATPVGKAIVAGTYGKFTITTTEAGIANGISTAVTDVLTLHYKSKHLKEILNKYGADVNTYIQTLALHLNNLEGEIKVMKTELQVKSVLMMNVAANDADRFILFSLFKEKKESLDLVITEYVSKQQMVQKIYEGHKQMLDNITQLKSASLKQKLLALATEIQYLPNK
jgi:hypothetical protein